MNITQTKHAGPHHVLKSSRVTEKTTHAAERYNCYVIEVTVSCNKSEIRDAVEGAWSVRVLGVRTQMRIGKFRRHKGVLAQGRPRKFAYITLHIDDRLSFF